MGFLSYAELRVFRDDGFRGAVLSAVAMLVSFGSALLLEHLAGLNVDVIVLTVVLSLSLGRTQGGLGLRSRLIGLATLMVIAVCAAEVGGLMHDHPDVGDGLFTACLGLAIWIRRFGPATTKAGTLMTMPFIAILVTPLPLPPGPAAPFWGAAASLIAFGWVSVLQLAADRIGFTNAGSGAATGDLGASKPAGDDVAASKPVSDDSAASNTHGEPAASKPTRGEPADSKSARGGPVRLAASSRMAVQMVVALGAAFTVGRWAYPDHWTWVVLTAFIVCSGNRGRGDVVYKAGLRIAGAAVGTLTATALAGLFDPGDDRSVALILAILAVATWLRTINYAYWAGCVTAALALLYGYFGQTGGSALLEQRLGGIVVGAALGITASWLVLPVKSGQVLRRRAADALGVLADLSKAVGEDPERVPHHQARFRHALSRIDEVARPLEVHRMLTRRRHKDRPHPADAVDTVRGCAHAVANAGAEGTSLADLARARSELGRILRATRPPDRTKRTPTSAS